MWNLIYLIPLLIAAVAGIRSLIKKWDIQYRILSVLLLIHVSVELMVLIRPNPDREFYYYDISFPIRHLLLLTIYYISTNSVIHKITIIILGGMFLLHTFFCFSRIFFREDSFLRLNASLAMVYLSIAFFNELLKRELAVRLNTYPMAWFSTGVLIYHASIIPYLIMLGFYPITDNIPLERALNYLPLFLAATMYVFFAIAFLCTQDPENT
ncbi:hypothetical protein C7475_10593 [Chitinophaga sp. S165]|nr:hypothetical protein C7475_10593 [Chitinophaga sp. S165]